MLASLISYRPNRKKVTSKTPFSLGKRPDPASPHPYAAQVFDIGDSSFEEPEPETASLKEAQAPPLAPQRAVPAEPVNSPRVEVDIDFTPADWFPSHFLKTDSIAGPSGLNAAATAIASNADAAKSRDTLPTTDAGSEGEDDELSSASEDFVSNLEAMDASDFVNLPESESLMAQSTAFPSLMTARKAAKAAPSPIKIPNASLHGPRVQIVRSSASQSRPDSMFSLDGASAVSGTTLARALIGDSFVLSNDRSSRYRSGTSVLTRSDSATLPRGEHPFSPAWSARKSGAFTPIDGMGFPIPPVPPMPEELRRVIAETRDRLKVDDSAGKQTRRRSGSDAETPMTPLARTNSGSRAISEDARYERRVSRISEATTPASTAPVTPDMSSLPNSAATQSPDTSNFHNGVSPSTFPTSPGQSSTAASDARSSRDLDNVLDYYNFEPSPGFAEGSSSGFDPPTPDVAADPNRYHPAFSPITEESGSQLSPNSFRSRRTPNGKISLTSSPAPSTGSGRVDWRPAETREIRSLPPHPLLPIGDRRSTISVPGIAIPPPPLLAISNSYPALPTLPSSLDTDTDGPLLEPPSRSQLFNRQRSGSAPSPIKVVRDSRDITAYNITVSPLAENSSAGTTPVTEDGPDNGIVRQQQTFPETPSAFSPTFSPSGTASDRNSMMQPPVPQAGFTSLTQQALLTRAATTVRGARHSRQASLARARNRSTAIFPSAQTANMLKEVLREEGLASPDDESQAVDTLGKEQEEKEEKEEKPPADSAPHLDDVKDAEQVTPLDDSMTEPPESASMYTPSVQAFPSPPPPQPRSLHRLSQSSSSDAHWHALREGVPQDYHQKPLPAMPVSPASPAESEAMGALPPAIVEVVRSVASSSSSSLSRPSLPSPSTSPSQPAKPLSPPPSHKSTPSPSPSPAPPEPVEEPAPARPPTPPPVQEITVPSPTQPTQPRPALQLSPPPAVDPSLGSPHIVPVLTPAPRGADSPLPSAFGSPPPYYTVMYDRDAGRDNDRMTPSTGGSGSYPDHFSPSTPGTQLREQRSLSIQSIASPGPGRRPRARPPLPVGPRPSTSATVVPSLGRNRNGSVSSIASTMPGGRRVTSSSPRFQTPPLKWRGYTMDAAKWTFSSSQLQGIVSRAIRQSAEASSIRLLRMETVDTDIPEELHRLEMQRTDVKTRYKMLTRRRTNLFATLTSHLDGTEPEDQTYALRVVENLKEISTELDRLAEDLHSADEQIAQLTSLRDVHSASALAMALRKLNASFLKQIAEADALRTQVESLQAERDEAWTQAVDVANEYDDLNERMEISSPGPSSYNKRSSRVLAVKKSSIRVSKAGLRSSSRRSSVSSVNANRYSSSSGLPSASIDDIPPVPPIPASRRRPEDIRTDIPSRTPALSTTPTSETRALDRAQDELYNMLGISMPDKNSRRSQSVIMSAVSETENPILSSLVSSRRRSDASRPSSLPGNSALSEVLSAMTADRNAMLAALGMLND
ncbi:hypothetical protein B0H17DRAFT_163878 [Mycena rosella]|uniref:Uncharacterized protein n=1 Tax=Mycena rosella TaxID=1033263 RepID=A0AAD7DZX9_MYCRO|nr:hypothetical protein B0H17DRAFT_163878 [Mycena rosella]